MQRALESNIWKYTVLLIVNKRVFVAILGAYYLTIPGVTPAVIGTILLISNLSGFLFEIPSSYASDKMGHKQALVISRVLILLSSLFYLSSDNITLLILAGVFMSAGNAFHSGTGSAFMHETLRGLGRDNDYSRIMGKASAIGFAVPVILTVLIPFFVSISFKTPFFISLILDIIGLIIVLSLKVPPVPQEHIQEIRVTNFKGVLRDGYRLNFFSIALFSGLISGALFSTGGFRGAYQTFLEIPVIWYGVFFGTGRALASLLLAYSGKIKKVITFPFFLTFQLITYPLLMVLLGLVSTLWIIILIFIVINALQWGLSQIDEGYQLDVIKSSKFKATLLSTGSQMDQIIAAGSGFGLGLIIEHTSYQFGFFCSGIIFFTLLLPVYIYILRKYKAGAYTNIGR